MPLIQAGDQPGDADPEIVEHDDERWRKAMVTSSRNADRAAEAAALLDPAGAMLNHAENQLARPQGDLQSRGDHEEDLDRVHHRRRRARIAGHQPRREGDHEPEPRPGEDAAEHGSPVDMLRIGPANPDPHPFDANQQEDDHRSGREAEDDLQAVLTARRSLPPRAGRSGCRAPVRSCASCWLPARLLAEKGDQARSALDRYFVGRGHCKLRALFASFTASIKAGWT